MLLADLTTTAQRVLFAWERGSKLFVTESQKVNSTTKAVFFKQYLHQVCVRPPFQAILNSLSLS